MKVSDLRNAFEAGRPLVQAWLDIAVQMAAIRDDCRTKEIDWQQVKSLLKAQIQDAEKGETKRVDAILAKADNATAYADALNLKSSEKNISRDAPQQIVSISAGTPAPVLKPVQSAPPVPSSGTEKLRQQLQASIAAEGMPNIPGFLDRRPS